MVLDLVKGISQLQLQCNDSFTDITPSKPNKTTKNDYWYSLNCSINGQWEGVFPLCVPSVQCPGLEYLEQLKDPSVEIESIENVYYVNESHWVAGEHSHVNFACANSDNIVIGKTGHLMHEERSVVSFDAQVYIIRSTRYI